MLFAEQATYVNQRVKVQYRSDPTVPIIVLSSVFVSLVSFADMTANAFRTKSVDMKVVLVSFKKLTITKF